MQDRQDPAVTVMNRLIETALDSAHGYAEAAGQVREGRLRTLFGERARRREDLARQLQQEVRTFGAAPPQAASLGARTHGRLLDLAAALLGGRNEMALVDAVERGEDKILARFETALEAGALPPNARLAVSRACECLRADHEEISRLKHALH